MSARFERCALIGAGLIGASLAGAARRSGTIGHVVAVGRSLANLEAALVAGLVDEISEEPEAAVDGADLVMLAVPVVRSVELFPMLAEHCSPEALVTDVGSVKAPVVAAAHAAGLGPRFVGAHPLAGKADSGAAAADIDLFANRLCVLTPSAESVSTHVEAIASLWESVGSRTMIMDAGAHDRALSMTSHLPQMVAFALAGTVARRDQDEGLQELIAGGFRDTSRLAASNPEMWQAIVSLNRGNVLDSIDAFSAELGELRRAVADEDDEALVALFENARRFRHELRS
jgi:prephenate dehydrogenase